MSFVLVLQQMFGMPASLPLGTCRLSLTRAAKLARLQRADGLELRLLRRSCKSRRCWSGYRRGSGCWCSAFSFYGRGSAGLGGDVFRAAYSLRRCHSTALGRLDRNHSVDSLTIGLIYPEGIDLPEGVCESAGIVLHKSLTARSFRGANRVLSPDVAGPVTAEGHVENDVVVLEVLVNVASTLKLGGWLAPPTWVGVATRKVARDCASREEPDADGIACPFRSVDSSTICIETGAVCCCVVGGDLAPSVCILTRGIDITIGSRYCSAESASVADGAASACVKGHIIGCLRVDTLDDIDFTTPWPVWAKGPTVRIISLLLHSVACCQ
jgi:hypothetical protein